MRSIRFATLYAPLLSVAIAATIGGHAAVCLAADSSSSTPPPTAPAAITPVAPAPAAPSQPAVSTPATTTPGYPGPDSKQTAPAGADSVNRADERNFYEVLEDVLGDFEFDIKNGDVQGLKDLAVRNIAVSENVPPSFKSHLELSITERILKNAKTRVIQCLPCRARRTTLNGDQVVISSAETNPVELARIAKLAGILNMMDVAFSYQRAGMVLSMYIVDPETGGIIWSRSYNSETSRAAAFRRGVDFSQVDEARRKVNYTPAIQYRLGVDYLFEPNMSSYTGCLAFVGRIVERYDNRSKEVGFELNYIRDVSTFTNPDPAAAGNLYAGFNLTMLFVHGFNFIGAEENYNRIRGNLYFGIGGTFTSGYLGGLIRAGWEWRLAKHWAITTVLGYRPSATAFLPGIASKSVSGVEFGLGVSALF